MTSRTAEGKHTKRFIILVLNPFDNNFVRSYGLPGFYSTKEEAQAAISVHAPKFPDVLYKVRQK